MKSVPDDIIRDSYLYNTHWTVDKNVVMFNFNPLEIGDCCDNAIRPVLHEETFLQDSPIFPKRMLLNFLKIPQIIYSWRRL